MTVSFHILSNSFFSINQSLDAILTEDFYLLGYNAVKSTESQPAFQTNMSPPSSGSKNKPSKKPVKAGSKQSKRIAEISDYIAKM
jgi:hypothetical protein